MNNKKVSIVIPAYKPDSSLIDAVESLALHGYDDFIIIDDGGGDKYKSIFDRLRDRDDCTVLTHEVNKGKGAALKTAFAWYSDNRNNAGVVTVDADGQHKPKDVKAVADELCSTGVAILGARDFKSAGVPLRSRFGNKISSFVFRFFLRMRVTDTQTGLRAVPNEYVGKLCDVNGDRYEYETNMLLFFKKNALPVREVIIETVYENDNESSHFRPVVDSMKIYKSIFKYIFTSTAVLFLMSSMICYFLDWILFVTCNYFLARVTVGTYTTTLSYGIARLSSSLINFSLNRRIFKNNHAPVLKAMVKYYLLVAFNILIGSVAIHFISKMLLGIGAVERFCMRISEKSVSTVLESIIKIPVDGLLYFCSYNVQKKVVFKNKKA